MKNQTNSSLIDSKKAWFIWLIGTSFYFYQFFLRSSPSAMEPVLLREFNISATVFGVFASAYYWCYAPLQIPVGMLLDHWGSKRVICIGILLCVAGTILFSIAPVFWVAIIARALIGTGAAVAFIGPVRLCTLWFSPAHVAFAIGVTASVGKFGGTISNMLLPEYISMFPSWRWAVFVLALIGAGIFFVTRTFVQDSPKDDFNVLSKKLDWKVLIKELKAVISIPTIWIVGLYAYFTYLPLSVLADAWSGSFLKVLHKMPCPQAAKLGAFILMGSAVGGIVVAGISDYFKNRVLCLRYGALIALIASIFLFFFPPISVAVTCFLLFCIGFFCAAQILTFVVGAEVSPNALVGTASGCVNMLMMLSGAIQTPLVGWILGKMWDGTRCPLTNMPVYTLTDFRWAFSTIIIGLGIAFFLTFFMPETYPKGKINSKKA